MSVHLHTQMQMVALSRRKFFIQLGNLPDHSSLGSWDAKLEQEQISISINNLIASTHYFVHFNIKMWFQYNIWTIVPMEYLNLSRRQVAARAIRTHRPRNGHGIAYATYVDGSTYLQQMEPQGSIAIQKKTWK